MTISAVCKYFDIMLGGNSWPYRAGQNVELVLVGESGYQQ